MKRGYKDNFLDKQFERLSTMEKKKSLLTSKPDIASTNQSPLVITFSKTLQNIKNC